MTENTEKMLFALSKTTARIYASGTAINVDALTRAIMDCCKTAYVTGRSDEALDCNFLFIKAQGKESVVREG